MCGRTGRTRSMVGEMLPPRSVGAWHAMMESGEGNLGCRVSEERARFADSFFAISGDNGTTLFLKKKLIISLVALVILNFLLLRCETGNILITEFVTNISSKVEIVFL